MIISLAKCYAEFEPLIESLRSLNSVKMSMIESFSEEISTLVIRLFWLLRRRKIYIHFFLSMSIPIFSWRYINVPLDKLVQLNVICTTACIHDGKINFYFHKMVMISISCFVLFKLIWVTVLTVMIIIKLQIMKPS